MSISRTQASARWLEASAWGIPFVGDRRIYPEIEPGVTGFHARTPDELAAILVRLIDDEELRLGVGARARAEVAAKHSMDALAPRWVEALA